MIVHRLRFPREQGFALAAVLWLLAGLTILAAMISQSNQILAERQAKLKQRADAEQAFLSSRSEALFWISTSRATKDGFGWPRTYLQVDGRGYAGAEKSTIQLQDIKGLLSLNRPDRAKLARLLVACGAAEGDTDALIDALEDYQEPGKLKRVNGAKDFEYAAAGMRPPRGAPLLAEPEIWRVFGWAALEKSWVEQRCFEDVTVFGDKSFNASTATPRALAAYGLTAEQVSQVEHERVKNESTLISRIQQANDANGFMGFATGRVPSRTFRITHTAPDMPWALRYELKIATNTEGVPWFIFSPRRLPLASVMIPAGRAEWPRIDQISETDKNAITQPILPF